MSVKRFALFCLFWALACALVIEPHWVTPAFSGQGLLELALNGVHSDALTTGLSPSQGAAVESMDHFRVLCLMYFGVPLALYLGTHLKSL